MFPSSLRRAFAAAITVASLAALARIGGGLGASAAPPPPASVVLITIDTLRADYVSAYGSSRAATPALDSLAADGVLFRNAYCQVPLTPPSHATILTGAYPATHGLRDFTSARIHPGIPSFATILGARGYQTAAFVSAFVLDRSWGLDAGFDLYDDQFKPEDFEGVNPGNVQRRGDETIGRVVDWLPTAKEPFFVWVHLFDPHHDYNPPEPFKSRYRQDLYAGEVAFSDSQVGRLLGVLKERGIYERSLIIATSDHGEGLGEHDEQEHGFFLYESTLHVPLIIKLPTSYSLHGKQMDTIAETVDILPTALQILRVPGPNAPSIEGTGLLSDLLGKRRRPGFAYAETLYPQATFGWSSLRAYREDTRKVIDAPRPEFYDLQADPSEKRDLFASKSALANQLLAKLRQIQSGFKPVDHDEGDAPDAERLERLGSLGYVSLEKPATTGSSANLPDPKDKVGVYNRVLLGLQAAEAGKLQRSNTILEEVAESNPELFVVHFSLGNNYLKLHLPERALAAFEQARRLNPEFPSAQINSARALAMLGRGPEAIKLLEELVQKPDSPVTGSTGQAHFQIEQRRLSAWRELALLYSRNHRSADAIAIYQKILEARPADLQALQALGIAEVEARDYAAGLKSLDQVIGQGTDNALIRNFRGIALANLGRGPEAIQSYQAAIRLNPKYPLPRLNLSLTLLQTGRKEEALKEFEALCQTSQSLCNQYRGRFQ